MQKAAPRRSLKNCMMAMKHRLRKQGLLDFDDMLAMCYELF